MLELFLLLPISMRVLAVVFVLLVLFLLFIAWEISRAPLYADDEMRERIYTDKEKAQADRRARAKAQATTSSKKTLREDTGRQISAAPAER